MTIYRSEIQPEYAVHYYSKKEFGSGAGYYLYELYDVDSHYSHEELKDRGGMDETILELRLIGHFHVFGEPFQHQIIKLRKKNEFSNNT